jgi:hypothetical protein
LVEVMVEFVIGEVSCLKTTSDQVRTWKWLGVEVVDKCPESPADAIALHRVPDLSTDRVRHAHRTLARLARYETDS